MHGPSRVRRSLLALSGLVSLAACGPKEDITPEVAIAPGFEARVALMDRYRLHDEDRRRMMIRPHVWVEDAPETDADGGADGGGD